MEKFGKVMFKSIREIRVSNTINLYDPLYDAWVDFSIL